jgi:hypothetical protein
MAGLDPAILLKFNKDVDARDKPGHDESFGRRPLFHWRLFESDP